MKNEIEVMFSASCSKQNNMREACGCVAFVRDVMGSCECGEQRRGKGVDEESNTTGSIKIKQGLGPRACATVAPRARERFNQKPNVRRGGR